MMTMDGAIHLTDAELMAVLDREPGAESRRGHLEECERCSGAFAVLRRDARLVAEWLDAAAFEEPSAVASARGRVTGAGGGVGMTWLKAAAVVALMAAPVAAFPGLRSWLTGGEEAAVEMAPASAPAAAMAQPQAGAAVRFVPAGVRLELVFEHGDGVLTVSTAAGAEAVFEAAGGTAVPVVSERAVRVTGGAERYTLVVPESVSTVSVLVGDVVLRTLDAADLRRGVSVPLR